MTAQVFQTAAIANGYPAITASGAHDLVAVRADFALTEALEADDIIEMLELPPGYVPVDVILDTDDLDTGTPGITLDVGILDGAVGDTKVANRTNGAEFLAASTVGQAGGIARAAVKGFTRLAPSDSRRSIGVTVKAGPGTGATTGTVSLTVLYRPAIHGA